MTQATPLDYPTPVARTDAHPRLWPGIVILLLQWAVIKIPEWVAPESMIRFMGMMWGPVAGALLLIIWWMFFSRLTWTTRLLGLGAYIVGLLISFLLGHKSMQMVLFVLAAPIVATVWVGALLAAARLAPTHVRLIVAVCLLLGWCTFLLFRFDGVNGQIGLALSLRTSDTPEQRYLASLPKPAPTTAPTVAPTLISNWPAFRGPNRDGRLTGVKIDTDWSAHPPIKLWRHRIGPGWSSFCIAGTLAITQEQRGEKEVVSAWDIDSGNPIWVHETAARFEEALAGPGPRATPTFHEGKIYAFGATGKLDCLDAATGQPIWSHDVKADSGAPLPTWGFSSSPLIAKGNVIVLSGASGKSLCAYNAATGAPAWSVGDGWSYCSPQLSMLDGVEQVLYVNANGAVGVDPATGAILWQHAFPVAPPANRVTQPAVIDDDILIGASFGVGTRRVRLSHAPEKWKDQEIWTTRAIKPYYNDLVIHKGFIYGFDGSTLVCVDLQSGTKKWRTSKNYGNGQILLIADQDLLLVLSEQGEAALVDAKPEEYRELAAFQAIEGKTWNHPVIASGKLLVRNAEEAACYKLTLK